MSKHIPWLVSLVLVSGLAFAQTSLEKLEAEFKAATDAAQTELDIKVKAAQQTKDTKTAQATKDFFIKLRQELAEQMKQGNADAVVALRERMARVMKVEVVDRPVVSKSGFCGLYYIGHGNWTVSVRDGVYELREHFSGVISRKSVVVGTDGILFDWNKYGQSVLLTFKGKGVTMSVWQGAYSGVVPSSKPVTVWEGKREED